jgi:hypothetical protein
MAQGVVIKERIEILQKSSTTQQVIPGSDSVYAGKILFEVPGTLLLRLGGPWWFGPSIMLGDCWVNPDWPTPLCECQPNPDGFGMDITVEKGGSSIFHYNGGDYYSLSNTPPPPEFGCGDGPFWAWNYTEDPFYYYNGGVELGPFQVGDEVTITVAVSGCAGLSYRARDTIVSCGNSNFNLAYRLSHPYTDVSCPGISTDWGEYYSDVDLPWILVEIPDMPVLNQNCLVTSVSNTKIHPGEKVGITINQLDCLGNPTPIPPDQVIDLWMNTDARYGKLRCTADSGTSIIGTQPFEFIAADSIDMDSVVVQIQAQLDYGGGGASSIGVGKDTLRSGSIMANVQMKAKNIGDASNEMKKNGLEYTIDRLQSQLNKASAKKGNEKQQQILTKGIEQLKVRLAYQTARTPAAKQSSLAKKQQIAKTSSVQEECNSTASVTIEGIELVVTPPAEKIQKIAGTNPPTMPKLTIRARLLNYDKEVSFYATFTKLQWTAPGTDPQRITTGYFEGNKTGSGEVEIPFTLPDGYIRGGDDITIDVRAIAEGKTYIKTLTNPFKIEGLNPNKSDVCAEISSVAPTTVWNYVANDIKMLQIITFLESTFRQFQTSPGFPYQGNIDKNDFGIMQINQPDNDDLIWNWKKNIAGGMNKYNQKKKSVADYIDAIKEARCWAVDGGTKKWTALQPTLQYYYADPKDSVTQIAFNPTSLIEEQIIQEIFQRYNGGVYWRWVPTDIMDPTGPGKWIEDPFKMDDATNMYGGYSIRCMEKYNGNCPCQ